MDANRIHDGFKALGINYGYGVSQPSADAQYSAFKQYSILETGNVSYSDCMKKMVHKK